MGVDLFVTSSQFTDLFSIASLSRFSSGQVDLFTYYSILSLARTPGTVEICSPYPEFVLTGLLGIKKALKGTETMFILTGISY